MLSDWPILMGEYVHVYFRKERSLHDLGPLSDVLKVLHGVQGPMGGSVVLPGL